MIRRILLICSVLAALVTPVLLLQQASAVDILQGPCNNPNAQSTPQLCNDDRTSSGTNPIYGKDGILTIAVQLLALLTGVIAVIIIVVEGFRMVLAGSDAGVAAQARRGILWACAALVVALMAQSLVAFVLNKL